MNKILAFIGDPEGRLDRSFDRLTDMSALSAVDLSFKYVFHVALYRRISRAGREALKSAFLVTDPVMARYVKLHALLMDHSPLKVAMFDQIEEVAKWLDVPVGLLRARE